MHVIIDFVHQIKIYSFFLSISENEDDANSEAPSKKQKNTGEKNNETLKKNNKKEKQKKVRTSEEKEITAEKELK